MFGASISDAPAFADVNNILDNYQNEDKDSIKDAIKYSVNSDIFDITNDNFTVIDSTQNIKKKSAQNNSKISLKNDKKFSGFTGGAATLPTLNTVKYEASEYLQSPVMHDLTKATGNISNDVVNLIINGDTYYYNPDPSEDFEFLQLIASYANLSLITTTDASKAMYKYGDTMYTYDQTNLPLSVYKEFPSTSSDYNYMLYTTDAQGNNTHSYYNIDIEATRTKLSGIEWDKLPDGSGYSWGSADATASDLVYSADEKNVSGAIRFTLPHNSTGTQTQYYKFSYDIPYDSPQTTKITATSDVINQYFYKIHGSSNPDAGMALNVNANGLR